MKKSTNPHHHRNKFRFRRPPNVAYCHVCGTERETVGGVFAPHLNRYAQTIDKSGRAKGPTCSMTGRRPSTVSYGETD